MRKKYVFTGVVILLILMVIYFWNIIFAIALNSENIDRHTLGVMLQGRFKPTKEINLVINGSSYNIPLPSGSGQLKKNEYLVPKTSWKDYNNALTKSEWDYFDQLGSLIRVKNKIDDEFNMSMRSFTGAYVILKYSLVNK
jgi:hypothetical protein